MLDLSSLNWGLIINVISVLSFIILIITLMETRKQHIDSSRPIIVFKGVKIKILEYPDSVGWYMADQQSLGEINGLHFENTGLGPANDIRIDWRINGRYIKREIKRLFPSGSFDERLANLISQKADDVILSHERFNQNVITSLQENVVLLDFPVDFQMLYRCLIQASIAAEFDGLLELKPIKIKVRYQEISGKRRRRNLSMGFKLYVQRDERSVSKEGCYATGEIFLQK